MLLKPPAISMETRPTGQGPRVRGRTAVGGLDDGTSQAESHWKAEPNSRLLRAREGSEVKSRQRGSHWEALLLPWTSCVWRHV